MKYLVSLTLVALLFLGVTLVCHGQTIVVTNGDSLLTISNGVVIATTPLTNAAPVLVTTNGQVVPQAFIDALASATGVPSEILKVLPLKALVWLFVISVGLPVVCRWGRKLIPDKWQTGKAGELLAHGALEINPQSNPARILPLAAPLETTTTPHV